MMVRRRLFLLAAFISVAGTMGCWQQPFLADEIGLLPGPSTSLLDDILGGGSTFTTSLGGLDIDSLLSSLGSTTTTNGETTTTNGETTTTNGETTTQDCPDGEVWVDELGVCLPEAVAEQYGV